MVDRKRRPTQSDIARAAGVSPAVVSLVINGRTNGKIKISKVTQSRVRAAIRDLGYVPNMAARQLAGGRNHLLGVFTYEPAFPLDQGNFYYPFLVGIEEQAETLSFDLLLFTRTASGSGKRQIYHDGINALQAADGAVLLGTHEDRDELARLHRDGFPFVFVGRRMIDDEPLAYVGADYESATAEVVRHLIDCGHRNLLYIGGQLRNESAEDRERGFRIAMAETSIPAVDERIIRPDCSTIPVTFVRDWLEQGVTAFICEGLSVARNLIRDADRLGLRTPTDFSVAALGNSGADLVDDDGTVTSLLIPRREMGAGAVQMLVNILYHPAEAATRQVLLPCTVTHGQTVGPPGPASLTHDAT